MPYLNVSHSDVTLLSELLEQEQRGLPVLVHHATTWRAKEILRSRLDHVDTLLEKVRDAGKARRAAP